MSLCRFCVFNYGLLMRTQTTNLNLMWDACEPFLLVYENLINKRRLASIFSVDVIYISLLLYLYNEHKYGYLLALNVC